MKFTAYKESITILKHHQKMNFKIFCFFSTSNRFKYFLVFSLLLISCNNISEDPLGLRAGAEPSAKMRNDLGIKHFKAGRNFDALLQFNQANLADPTSGEIHFNLALTLWKENKKQRAVKHFKKALKFAKGNALILESPILNKILEKN